MHVRGGERPERVDRLSALPAAALPVAAFRVVAGLLVAAYLGADAVSTAGARAAALGLGAVASIAAAAGTAVRWASLAAFVLAAASLRPAPSLDAHVVVLTAFALFVLPGEALDLGALARRRPGALPPRSKGVAGPGVAIVLLAYAARYWDARGELTAAAAPHAEWMLAAIPILWAFGRAPAVARVAAFVQIWIHLYLVSVGAPPFANALLAATGALAYGDALAGGLREAGSARRPRVPWLDLPAAVGAAYLVVAAFFHASQVPGLIGLRLPARTILDDLGVAPPDFVEHTRPRPPRAPPEAAPPPAPAAAPTDPGPPLSFRAPARFPAGDGDAFVGSARCEPCHRAETQAWRSSPHAGAAARPGDARVAGDFTHATTPFPGGSVVADIEGGYAMTLGVGGRTERLSVDVVLGRGDRGQAYLTKTADGRERLLPFYWSATSREWVPIALLYPTASDMNRLRRLELSGIESPGCLACHATDASIAPADPSPRWGALGVGCEGCHGPGREHVDSRGRGGAAHLGPIDAGGQARLCGECHGAHAPYRDHDARDVLFFRGPDDPDARPDGTQLRPFYEYAGFTSSRCHREGGARCTTCHDAHGAGGAASADADVAGRRACLGCHADLRAPAAAANHSHHAASVACASCHMAPSWLLDEPRLQQATADHAIAIPRPREAASLHLPDPCATCHAGVPTEWFEAALRGWGATRSLTPRPWVMAIADARAGRPDATLTPRLVDALRNRGELETAAILRLLGRQPRSPDIVPALVPFAASPSAEVRGAAIAALAVHDGDHAERWRDAAAADTNAIVRLLGVELGDALGRVPDAQKAADLDDLLATALGPPTHEVARLARLYAREGRRAAALQLVDLALPWSADADRDELEAFRAQVAR